MKPPIGILGGTFDPVHFGHLRPALELLEELNFAQILLIPSQHPPHRPQPEASPAQRLAMLQQAVASEPRLVVDARELERDGPSYTVDTLRSLRTQWPDTPLCFCLGLDAFLGLPQWYNWRELSSLAHLVVSHRPGWQLDSETMSEALQHWLTTHRADSTGELHDALAGKIWLQQVSQLAISATGIRQGIAAGHSARYLLPDPVWDYIQQQQLYRP
ncbi:MAG: nicotinate-nucleotide adenylyltransferase [Thiohalomonadaceae bacterium]